MKKYQPTKKKLKKLENTKQKQIMATIEEFTDACGEGDSARVEQMLRDKPEFLNQKDEYEFTGLMCAAYRNKPETLKLLLSEPDVDLSLQQPDGMNSITLATLATAKYNIDCLKLLLLHPKCTKAIVEMKNNYGRTAEMTAKTYGLTECEQLLKLKMTQFQTQNDEPEKGDDEIPDVDKKVPNWKNSRQAQHTDLELALSNKEKENDALKEQINKTKSDSQSDLETEHLKCVNIEKEN